MQEKRQVFVWTLSFMFTRTDDNLQQTKNKRPLQVYKSVKKIYNVKCSLSDVSHVCRRSLMHTFFYGGISQRSRSSCLAGCLVRMMLLFQIFRLRKAYMCLIQVNRMLLSWLFEILHQVNVNELFFKWDHFWYLWWGIFRL